MSDNCKNCGACACFVRCNCCGACRTCGRYHNTHYYPYIPNYPYYVWPQQPVTITSPNFQTTTWTSSGIPSAAQSQVTGNVTITNAGNIG